MITITDIFGIDENTELPPPGQARIDCVLKAIETHKIDLDECFFIYKDRAEPLKGSLLHMAIEWNDSELAKFLLEQGANPNALTTEIGGCEYNDRTHLYNAYSEALHIEAFLEDLSPEGLSSEISSLEALKNIFQLLLEYGANIHQKSSVGGHYRSDSLSMVEVLQSDANSSCYEKTAHQFIKFLPPGSIDLSTKNDTNDDGIKVIFAEYGVDSPTRYLLFSAVQPQTSTHPNQASTSSDAVLDSHKPRNR